MFDCSRDNLLYSLSCSNANVCQQCPPTQHAHIASVLTIILHLPVFPVSLKTKWELPERERERTHLLLLVRFLLTTQSLLLLPYLHLVKFFFLLLCLVLRHWVSWSLQIGDSTNLIIFPHCAKNHGISFCYDNDPHHHQPPAEQQLQFHLFLHPLAVSILPHCQASSSVAMLKPTCLLA